MGLPRWRNSKGVGLGGWMVLNFHFDMSVWPDGPKIGEFDLTKRIIHHMQNFHFSDYTSRRWPLGLRRTLNFIVKRRKKSFSMATKDQANTKQLREQENERVVPEGVRFDTLAVSSKPKLKPLGHPLVPSISVSSTYRLNQVDDFSEAFTVSSPF